MGRKDIKNINHKNNLLNKIISNTETIGIIDLGYVGLPLAVNFAQAGIKVIGFDNNTEKVEKINTGENYINDIRDAVLREVVKKITFCATTNFKRIKECDALLICVPTPFDKFRKPNMSYIESACKAIGKNMKTGTFISLESTTYPTTTEEFMLPIIEKESGLKAGNDFWLAYSPERVDPGNKDYHTRNTPKVLGAMCKDGLEIGNAIFNKSFELSLESFKKLIERF
ncbi:MAG: hypothetical protein HQ541_13205 [Mariniphaga sp.]|nr:hypothetical protein [Mariniphaga sp.]